MSNEAQGNSEIVQNSNEPVNNNQPLNIAQSANNTQTSETTSKRNFTKSSSKKTSSGSSGSLSAEDKYNEYISNLFINALEKGTAPWTKPWSAKEMCLLAPTNPESGTKYRGNNELVLVMSNAVQGFNDNRWMTYNQAKACGGNVRTGEKGTPIVIYITEREVPVLDEQGKPTLDENGKIVTETEELEKPIRKTSYVFNVKQINFPEGHKYSQSLTDDVSKEQEWENLQAVEDLIKNTGAKIYNDSNQAYYQPSTDSIHLPVKEAFQTQEGYYSTALHELSHWTGHSDRLNRPLAGRYGSDGYAREELVAEISSFMLCLNHGIGHNLENHASYVKSWSEDLKENRNEIIVATRKAFEAQRYISSFSNKNILDEDRTYLLVPDNEESFKKVTELGACYDTEQKRWYITPEHDFAKFNEWLPDNKKVITTENNLEKIEPTKDVVNTDFDLTRCTEVIKGAIDFVGEASNTENLTEEEREAWSAKMDELIDLATSVKNKLLENRTNDNSNSNESISNVSNDVTSDNTINDNTTENLTDTNTDISEGNEIVVTLTNGKQLSKTIPYGSLFIDSYPDPICGLMGVFPDHYQDIEEVNKIDLSHETNAFFLFAGCENLKKIPELDTKNITNMEGMFLNCSNLKEITNLDTSNATTMTNMFKGCNSLTTIPILDTKNVQDMDSMFSYCKNLVTVPNIDAESAKTMYSMFYKCESLKEAPTFSNMHPENILNISQMFTNCKKLEDAPNIDFAKINNLHKLEVSSIFEGCDKIYEKYQTLDPIEIQKLSQANQNSSEIADEVAITNEENIIDNTSTHTIVEGQTNVANPIPPNETEQNEQTPNYYLDGFTVSETRGRIKVQLRNDSVSSVEGKYFTSLSVFVDGEKLKGNIAHTIYTSELMANKYVDLTGRKELSIWGPTKDKLEADGINVDDIKNLFNDVSDKYREGLNNIIKSSPMYKYFEDLNQSKVPDPKDLQDFMKKHGHLSASSYMTNNFGGSKDTYVYVEGGGTSKFVSLDAKSLDQLEKHKDKIINETVNLLYKMRRTADKFLDVDDDQKVKATPKRKQILKGALEPVINQYIKDNYEAYRVCKEEIKSNLQLKVLKSEKEENSFIIEGSFYQDRKKARSEKEGTELELHTFSIIDKNGDHNKRHFIKTDSLLGDKSSIDIQDFRSFTTQASVYDGREFPTRYYSSNMLREAVLEKLEQTLIPKLKEEQVQFNDTKIGKLYVEGKQEGKFKNLDFETFTKICDKLILPENEAEKYADYKAPEVDKDGNIIEDKPQWKSTDLIEAIASDPIALKLTLEHEAPPMVFLEWSESGAITKEFGDNHNFLMLNDANTLMKAKNIEKEGQMWGGYDKSKMEILYFQKNVNDHTKLDSLSYGSFRYDAGADSPDIISHIKDYCDFALSEKGTKFGYSEEDKQDIINFKDNVLPFYEKYANIPSKKNYLADLPKAYGYSGWGEKETGLSTETVEKLENSIRPVMDEYRKSLADIYSKMVHGEISTKDYERKEQECNQTFLDECYIRGDKLGIKNNRPAIAKIFDKQKEFLNPEIIKDRKEIGELTTIYLQGVPSVKGNPENEKVQEVLKKEELKKEEVKKQEEKRKSEEKIKSENATKEATEVIKNTAEAIVTTAPIIATVNTYITVPYKEKNEAKALGAKWDTEQKSWYIPKGEVITKFDKWKIVESKKTINIEDLKNELGLKEKEVTDTLKVEKKNIKI